MTALSQWMELKPGQWVVPEVPARPPVQFGGRVGADLGHGERFPPGLVGVAGDARRRDLYARSQVPRAVALGRGLRQQFGRRAARLACRQPALQFAPERLSDMPSRQTSTW
jgi:hypothetical protein